jgi:hypothetical protein
MSSKTSDLLHATEKTFLASSYLLPSGSVCLFVCLLFVCLFVKNITRSVYNRMDNSQFSHHSPTALHHKIVHGVFKKKFKNFFVAVQHANMGSSWITGQLLVCQLARPFWCRCITFQPVTRRSCKGVVRTQFSSIHPPHPPPLLPLKRSCL